MVLEDARVPWRWSRIQHGIIEGPCTVQWLEWYVPMRRVADALLSSSANIFRNPFNRILRILGLEEVGFTPASIRAGMATQDYLLHENLDRLQRRGRWAVRKTLECYLQEAVSLLVLTRLPLATKDRVHEIAALANTLLWTIPEAPERFGFLRQRVCRRRE